MGCIRHRHYQPKNPKSSLLSVAVLTLWCSTFDLYNPKLIIYNGDLDGAQTHIFHSITVYSLEDCADTRSFMKKKQCSKCSRVLSMSKFYSRTRYDKSELSSYCRDCHNEYLCERWHDNKIKAIEYLGGKCSKCGYDKHNAPLQFHHTDPESKDYSWNVLRKKSWPRIKTELDKCILLCANCHSIEHSSRWNKK